LAQHLRRPNAKRAPETLIETALDMKGLSSEEAAKRLRAIGPNQIRREQRVSPLRLFAGQFKSAVVWLLVVAGTVSFVLGDLMDALAIGSIVLLNAIVGFFQEYRAERAVVALREMTAPRARVMRDDKSVTIAAIEVVPGDLLLVDAGDIVAADAKLIEAHALLVNEAVLTGESAAVEKNTKPVTADATLSNRTDSLFMGTAIARGSGCALVTATGMQTELGKIAHLLATAPKKVTPLQSRLARVSRILLYACLAIVGAVAVLGIVRGLPAMDVFLSGVSLAVAAVPEGLPAIVTIALAVGVQRMADRHVLVRKLPAVETLGCVSLICTDKTGTLTTGVMRVRETWGKDVVPLLDAAAACCDAELDAGERTGTGDPTEVALLVAAAERGIRKPDIERERPRRATHPFDTERKRMSIARADGILYVKGAIEALLPLCRGGTEGAEAANEKMAARGLRVLAVASGQGDAERDLTLLGLVGIADPPREEAIAAVAAAKNAGIRTVMITGDHPATARAIAQELGILTDDGRAEDVVHARATPEQKLVIVDKWQSRGDVVAMTGDGVNDAPAVREADVGIAMGRTGTEVTREAADIILTDDNFASIIAGIREGRGIFDNIRKTLVYLLAGNASELFVMLGAAVLALPLPLLPLHLLWINLVTDGLPALALVIDPVDENAMKRPPRKVEEPMLSRAEWRHIGWVGLIEASVTLGVFAWALQAKNLEEARSLTFSVLVFAELFRAFAARSTDRIFWEVGAFTNLRLLGVVALSIFLQLGLHFIPWTQTLFRTHPLSLSDLMLGLSLGLIPVTLLELGKLARRLTHK
jgi:Ca2+-transporting ATPase